MNCLKFSCDHLRWENICPVSLFHSITFSKILSHSFSGVCFGYSFYVSSLTCIVDSLVVLIAGVSAACFVVLCPLVSATMFCEAGRSEKGSR